MKIGRLALRTVVGGLFVGHGTQKLFGWFEGHGLDATAEGFDAMGLRPGRTNAIIAGAGEALGGAAFAAGYQTPLAAAPLVGSMLMAIKHVHGKNGPWSHKGGYEYNLVLIAAALTIVEAGPGPLSLDSLRHKERQGLGWTLFAAALAAGGVAAVEQYAAMKAPAAQPESPFPAAAPEPAVSEPQPPTETAAAEPVAPEPQPADEPVAAEPVEEPQAEETAAADVDADTDAAEGDEDK
jgi:putative oxidoreductase